jgi:hypothetical protein
MSRKRSHEGEEEESIYDLIKSANPENMAELSKKLDEAHFVVGVFREQVDNQKTSLLIGPEDEVDEALLKMPFLRHTVRSKERRAFRDHYILLFGTGMFRACDPLPLDYEIIIIRSINGDKVEEKKIVASDSYTAVLEEMAEMAKTGQNSIVFSSIQAFPRGEWSKDAEELS